MNIQQDKGITHIPGHENHVCNKCGWSYPNPHPSAKNRRAHKKVCGSMNVSYDNIVFDDDTKKSGLVVPAPSNLVADKTEKGIDGIGEGLDKSKSEDGEFSAPIENTSESGLSPGVKEPLKQDSLDSGTTVEQIGIKAHEVPLSPINSGFVNVGNADFLSLRAKDDIPLELNSVEITNASTNGFQVESAHVEQFSTSRDVNILQEKGEVNGNVGTPPTHDDSPKVAHPQSEYEGFKDPEGVVSLKREDAPNSVTEENTHVFDVIHLSEKNVILSPEVHVVSSTDSLKEPVNFDNIETKAEKNTEVSPVKLKVESFDRLEAIGGSVKAIETETNESHIIPFTEEQKTVHSSKYSQQISLPEGSLVASTIENPRDASFASATSETIGVISIYNASHHEKNRTEINDIVVDGNNVRANVENGIGTKTKDLQPSNLLQLEAKQPRDLVKSDDVGESGKIEKCDIIETAVISESVVDGATKKAKALECTNGGPILASREDKKEDEINSNIKAPEEYNRSVDPFADSYQTKDAELSVKAAENLARKYTPTSAQHVSAVEDNREGGPGGEVSGITVMPVQDRKDEISSHVKVHEEYSRSIDPSGDSHHTHDAELLVKPVENLAAKYTSLSLNPGTSTQHDSAAEDNKDGEQGGKASGITYVPVQDRSVNNLVKHSSSGFDASIDSSSRCDSLEGNQGSVSVISLQSDAPAVIDTKTLPSTGSLASTEAGKSNVNNPEESFHKQQTGHMFNPKAAAPEVKKGSNPQQSDSTLTRVIIDESPRKKKNEEIIAKVTNPETGKVRSSLKSLLDEDAESEKANSSTLGGHSPNQVNGKFPEHNSSGLKTVNSILGPESPAAQAEKGKTKKECKSPARYPAGTKKEKGKPKTRPLWIQLVCCSYEPSRR